MPHPRFKISKGNDQQYYYNLTAANAEIILAGEGYTTRASAEKGVQAVKANATVDARYERREAGNGQLYFVLKAGTERSWASARRTRRMPRGRAGSVR